MLIFVGLRRVPIFVGCFYFIVSTSPIGICAALAAFYTTGMTVVLMGFVLEPLDYNAMNL